MSVQRQLGTYTYEDSDRGIKIVIKQIAPPKGHTKEGHITVQGRDAVGGYQEIFKGRHNISAVGARRNLAQWIERDVRGNEKSGDEGMQSIFGINSPILVNDWKATLSVACEEILKSYYQGSPPVNLYDKESEDDDVWRIPGLISEDINVIYGDSGSGKSYMSIVFAQAIHHGVSLCGLRTVKGNVLYLDYETTEAKMRRRLARVDEGLGISGEPMLYKIAQVPLVNMVEPLQELIIEHNIEFIIIDSLQRAVGGKITDEEGVGVFFEALKALETSCIVIHHTNRADEMYGSGYIKADARNLWRLRSVQSETEQQLSIQLQQEKENDGPGSGSLGFTLSFRGDKYDPTAVVLEAEDMRKMGDMQQYEKRLYMRIVYKLEETAEHRMRWDDLENVLGLIPSDKDTPQIKTRLASQRSTLRSYIWDLKDNTRDAPKYKALNELAHIAGDFICLNTAIGSTPVSIPEVHLNGVADSAIYEVDSEERDLVLG